MRLCVVGNSHVAALRSAYESDAGGKGAAINFFAVPGAAQPQLRGESGKLCLLNDRANVVSDIAEGTRELDTRSFDGLILSACGLYAARNKFLARDPMFHPCAVVARGDFAHETDKRPDHVPIVSHAVHKAVTTAFLEDTASIKLMHVLAQTFDGKVFIQPWPAPNRLLRDDSAWFVNAWYGTGGPAAWRAFFDTQREFLSNLTNQLGPRFFWLDYPSECDVVDGFIDGRWCDADPWHANKAYGTLVLNQVARAAKNEQGRCRKEYVEPTAAIKCDTKPTAFSSKRDHDHPREGAGLPTIFHMHMAKAGGTTVNTWLDTLTHVSACRPKPFDAFWPADMSHGILLSELSARAPIDLPIVDDAKLVRESDLRDERELQLVRLANIQYSWLHYKILHGQESLMTGRTRDSFVFTIVREPVARSISQFIDHKTLQANDIAGFSADDRNALDSVREGDFDAFIERCGRSKYALTVYSDTQCRLLLTDSVKWRHFYAMMPEERARLTIETIERYCDFIGVHEALIDSLRVLSSRIGLCPPVALDKLNSRLGHEKAREISSTTRDWLEKHNQADHILHEYALARFKHDAEVEGSYDVVAFEQRHAANRTRELSPIRIGDEYLFDMNSAIIGTGFHGREGAGGRDCIRWTGPETDVRIYFPVPAGQRLRLRVYNKGWIDWSLRNTLLIEVDGQPRPHFFEHPPGMAEAFAVETTATRGWMCVVIRIASTRRDSDVGAISSDDRKKGFALWGYGYRMLSTP